MLNENKIDNVEFLGNWDDEADAFKQSAIPEYAITYDSELLKTTPVCSKLKNENVVNCVNYNCCHYNRCNYR